MTAPITPDEHDPVHVCTVHCEQGQGHYEVRRHLPVRPDRETVARALRSFLPLTPEPALDSTAAAQADAVLALWPGRSEATVKAEALRDAAGILQASYDRDLAYPGSTDAADWLRALADRIAAEGGADRG